MTCLEVEGVTVAVGARRLLDDVSFTAARGEWLSLLGPNGAGKTTLLATAAGLRDFTGKVAVAGMSPQRLAARRLARLVALVPQQPVIPAALTVAEYILLGRTAHLGYLDQETPADRAIVGRLLARLGLDGFGERDLPSLSGGELQRVVIGRALAQQAPLLLLDEPTASLDVGSQREVLDLVDDLRSELGITVVAALHDLTLAAQYGDRLLVLSGGVVAAEGAAADVLTSARMEKLYGTPVRLVRDDDRRLIGVVPLRGGACRR